MYAGSLGWEWCALMLQSQFDRNSENMYPIGGVIKSSKGKGGNSGLIP